MTAMKTVGLISLGCPKNLVDSEVMLGLLEKAGYRIVQQPSEADILIVNTCSFIEDAKKESVDTILEMSEYKTTLTPVPPPLASGRQASRGRVRERGRCKKLIVAGCLPQRYKNELAKLLPEVDLFIGTGEYHKIVELLNRSGVRASMRTGVKGAKAQRRKDANTVVMGIPKYIHTSVTPRKLATAKHAVYVKIAEGCFHGCSFCVIPKIRGKFRSRTINDITAEARRLVKNGARELNLIGQDTTSYGRDLKDGSSLSKLLHKLAGIRGDFWIRIMYAYPANITDELIETIAALPKVCKYLDIPIQHINDKILSLMRRRERGADIRMLIEKLRTKIPNITLRTSLIAGFPGETCKEFNELLSFVKEGHFNHLGVFVYSNEEGTYASRLKGSVSQGVKEERRKKIMEEQANVSKKLNNKLVGKIVRVLIESKKIARTEGQAPEIDGKTMFHVSGSMLKTGEFARLKITKAGQYDLTGELC